MQYKKCTPNERDELHCVCSTSAFICDKAHYFRAASLIAHNAKKQEHSETRRANPPVIAPFLVFTPPRETSFREILAATLPPIKTL
jgi:hypothetical protein